MTPEEFIRKWKASTLKERSASQEHFINLCQLLGQPTPATLDSDGAWYCFEKGVREIEGGGDGFADVWMDKHFGWEYKGKHANLTKAYEQLLRYRGKLGNPPLLIVSDMERIEIHTNFTNTPEEVHTFTLDDLQSFENRERLKWIFTHPENFKPARTLDQITADAAEKFAELADRLRKRGHDPHEVAHFLSKVLFCLFAEDVGLLPKDSLTHIIDAARADMEHFNGMLRDLLLAMNEGGRFGTEKIRYFNGGLFNDEVAIPLEFEDTRVLKAVAELDWGKMEPSIFGTLFERGLDPSKRAQLGAHYTPRSDIERLVDPVVMEPLREEWARVSEAVAKLVERAEAQTKGAKATYEKAVGDLASLSKKDANRLEKLATKKAGTKKAQATKLINEAKKEVESFLLKVRSLKVLDPACGSGNFLYVVLERLHDLEKEGLITLANLGGGQQTFEVKVGPQQVLGIELNPYAFELAKVTVWIGHLQWMLRNGFGFREDPVLQPLNNIENRDAIMNADGTEPEWPPVDCIVGNPPFAGGAVMRSYLGDDYTEKLRILYKGRVSAGADLVSYWFEKSRQAVEDDRVRSVGLVATQAIRSGASREVLVNIRHTAVIFNAWSDEPWVNEGAAVRVSLVCFGKETRDSFLNGSAVTAILADLTGGNEGTLDLTKAEPLVSNCGTAFKAVEKNGTFEVPADLARSWLMQPNPHGKSNREVLRPWASGTDLAKRFRDIWIVDFGLLSEVEASLYEIPFDHVEKHVKATRLQNRREGYRRYWWRHGEPRPSLRKATATLERFIATPRVAKHRLFVWFHNSVLPDSRLFVIAREDDTTFGILHSRYHEVWSLAQCSWHGVGNDPTYNAHSVFETFPFPDGLTPNIPATDYATDPRAIAIGEAARELNELRERWLNPPEWVRREPEIVPGYPDRLLPVADKAEKELKKRTLTNLYNQRPAWLDNAHKKLDAAVAAAYGWEADLSVEEMLRRLLELNLERSRAHLSAGQLLT